MKNVRKLSATMLLTLVLGCSAFAGDISLGRSTSALGDISLGKATSATGVISGGKATSAASGDISSGIAQFLSFLAGITLS